MLKNTLVQNFGTYLIEDGKRPKTIQSYMGDVAGFIVYLTNKGTDFSGEIKRFHITSYRNYLVENSYEVSTINKKINSLQSFNRWLIEQGITSKTVVDLRKDRIKVASGSEKQIEVLSEKQLEKLLFYIQGDKATSRDRAIILALLYTGVRVSELCDIKVNNLDLLTNQLKVTGKGGKVREIPLKPEVVEAIREYLTERRENKYATSEALFLGQRGALQRDAVNTLLKKITIHADLESRLKPHTFRHTFCTRLVKKGIPLTTISKLAGHSSVETTVRFYVNTSQQDKIQAVSTL